MSLVSRSFIDEDARPPYVNPEETTLEIAISMSFSQGSALASTLGQPAATLYGRSDQPLLLSNNNLLVNIPLAAVRQGDVNKSNR